MEHEISCSGIHKVQQRIEVHHELVFVVRIWNGDVVISASNVEFKTLTKPHGMLKKSTLESTFRVAIEEMEDYDFDDFKKDYILMITKDNLDAVNQDYDWWMICVILTYLFCFNLVKIVILIIQCMIWGYHCDMIIIFDI